MAPKIWKLKFTCTYKEIQVKIKWRFYFFPIKLKKHLHTLSVGIQSGTTLLKGNLTTPNTVLCTYLLP